MADRALHVVQVSFHADHRRRDAETLLEVWPTVPSVAAAVARAGVEITVIQTAHRHETVRREGVEYQFLDDAHRRPKRVIDRVCSLAPSVVHVQGFHHSLAVHTLAAAARAPVLVQDHGSVEPHGWRRLTWRWAFRPIAATAFTVREQAAPWKECGVLRRDLPVFDVLDGSSTFTPGDQAEARRVTGLGGNPCLLWTGRLNANKDPLMMLDAVERALASLPDGRLWCCFGDAPMLADVRARIQASDTLRDRVALLGTRPRDHMELLYRSADFYIQTSHREGGGYSLLEAMSCGTSGIVTDIPPSRRIVGDGGSLTPVGDAPALAAAIVDWSSRDFPTLRRRARQRFEHELTFDAIGRQLCDAYESLAASRAS